jgi:hypothetical protein
MNGPFKMKPGRGNMPKTGRDIPTNMVNPSSIGADDVEKATKSVSDFASKVNKPKSNFKSSSVSDLKITDPVKKKYDGYSSHRTLRGRKGTNTTASGETLFPGYSSKSIGTYKKHGQTFNKIRPGAEAKSFGEYENMAKKQKSRKINKGIDPIKVSNIKSGKSRQAGTFTQYLTTEDYNDRLPNMASNTFKTKSNYKRQAKLDNYLEKKLYSK